MSHLPPAKGRTLYYSERRAICDAGASAYRWFEESIYNDSANTNAVTVSHAARLTAAFTVVAMAIIVAAIATVCGAVPAVVAAVAVIAAVVLPRPSRDIRVSVWVWPALAATAVASPVWSIVTLAIIIALPAIWWTPVGVATIVAALVVHSFAPPSLIGVTITVALVVAAALATWRPVDARSGFVHNLCAAWKRPPIDTNTLHKPLPDRSLPWLLTATHPGVRRTINEARKNLDEQTRPLADSHRAKIVGSIGERTTAMQLLGLPRWEWLQVHDIKVPGDNTANIDHVIIGPSGVWIVDAKQYRGTITLSDRGIRHNDTDLSGVLRTLAWEAGHLARALDTHVQALMLVPTSVCDTPIAVTVPARGDSPETTAIILTSRHLADWLATQPSSTSLLERFRVLALLLWRTEGAYGPGTTPHPTVSRGLSYASPTASLATRTHSLTTRKPQYRRGG